jgi:hypothetical protein
MGIVRTESLELGNHKDWRKHVEEENLLIFFSKRLQSFFIIVVVQPVVCLLHTPGKSRGSSRNTLQPVSAEIKMSEPKGISGMKIVLAPALSRQNLK